MPGAAADCLLATMSVGLWVIVAVGAYLAFSFPAVLVLGAVLGRISEMSEALEMELWTSARPRPHLAQSEKLAIGEKEALANGDHRSRRTAALVK
jgi:hypothetical protein